jgi:DNA-binding MarR family transcriptional regulator
MFQSAEAQRRAMGGLRPGNVSPARLLMVDEVQDELKLTDEQRSTAKEIIEKLTAGRQKLFAEIKKGDGKRASGVAKLEREAQSAIDELLNDQQMKRLDEIMLQVNGASQLARKEVRERLKVTEEQEKKLAEVRRRNAKARRDALANFEGDRMAKSVELQREADAKFLEVLTPEQRKQLEAMQGKKLEIKLFSS